MRTGKQEEEEEKTTTQTCWNVEQEFQRNTAVVGGRQSTAIDQHAGAMCANNDAALQIGAVTAIESVRQCVSDEKQHACTPFLGHWRLFWNIHAAHVVGQWRGAPNPAFLRGVTEGERERRGEGRIRVATVACLSSPGRCEATTRTTAPTCRSHTRQCTRRRLTMPTRQQWRR